MCKAGQQEESMVSGKDERQSTRPSLRSFEADLLGPLMGFHQKATRLLRDSKLGDDKLTLVGERTRLLIDRIVDEMKHDKNFDLAERMEAAYEDVERYVNELSGLRGDGDWA